MRSYSEGWSPKRQSGRYIYMRVSPLAITVALLEDIIGHPINRPYLSVVCMPTELQVDAGSFGYDGHHVLSVVCRWEV